MRYKDLSRVNVLIASVVLASAAPLSYAQTNVPLTAEKTAITTKSLAEYKTQSVVAKDHDKESKYSGVSLRSLVAKQVPGIDSMSDWKNLAKDRLVIEVTGSDGFPALIPATELAMNQSGDKFLLATECDGKAIADGIRLICPQDEHHVRWVRQVESMRLVHVPKP